MSISIFQSLSSKVLDPFKDYVNVSSQFIDIVMPLIVLVLTISIMWHGYETIRGKGGQNAFLDVFWKSARTMLVVGLALTGGAYIDNIVGGVTELQDTLVNILAGTTPDSNPFVALDASMDKAFTAFKQVYDANTANKSFFPSFPKIMMVLNAGVILLCMGAYAVTAFLEILIMKLMLMVCFAVGPVFLGLYAFETTAKFFDAWLGAVLSVIFTTSLIMMMVGIGNSIFSGYADAMTAGINDTDWLAVGFSAVFAIVALIVLTKKVPEIAAKILGGVALSSVTPGVAGPLAAIASMAGSAAGGVGRGVAHAAGNTAVGANVAGKIAGASEKFANTGVGAVMQSVAGNKGFIESFHAGANRHAQKKTSGGAGTGSVTGGDRPVTQSMRGMMATHQKRN